MKNVCVLAVLVGMIALAGCSNSKLTACQTENESLKGNVSVLQQELQSAKDAVGKKDKTIEDLKAENVQMQTKAMEGIKTMMERQSAKDQEVKDKLTAAQKENTNLRAQLEQAKTQLNQAMESQSTKDQEVKDKLTAAQKENTNLRAQLEQAKAQLNQTMEKLKATSTPAPAPAPAD
ncbi:MAG: hypothetical protein LLF76_13635 [Planctomycetaceae bacterium]|nr:hypothetical protein [Planctomycetaceae bacterium]